jgi:hypothetical protein
VVEVEVVAVVSEWIFDFGADGGEADDDVGGDLRWVGVNR